MCADATKSTATPQKQTTSDEGEDPHDHSGGHARPESGPLEAMARSVNSKVVHRMPEVQRGDQNSNSGQNVQDSHLRSRQKSSAGIYRKTLERGIEIKKRQAKAS